jgi:hypothetical protein
MMASAGDPMTRPGAQDAGADRRRYDRQAEPDAQNPERRHRKPRPHEGPRQPGGAAGALHADLGAGVFDHRRAGAFERGAGAGVAREHHALPRREGEHVGAHRVELLVWRVDEADAAGGELFVEGHGEEPRVYDGQIAVD